MGGTVRPSAFAVLTIDDEFELGRLLDGEVGGFGTLQNLVHVGSGAPEEVDEARAIGHQTAIVRELAKAKHGREVTAGGQGHDPSSICNGEGVIEGDEGLGIASYGSRERRLEVVGSANLEWLKRHPQFAGSRLRLCQKWHGRDGGFLSTATRASPGTTP